MGDNAALSLHNYETWVPVADFRRVALHRSPFPAENIFAISKLNRNTFYRKLTYAKWHFEG
jgi:hypothetical protein